ncbi:MAG: hypothetical protein AAB821_01915 [Patescibacteria group bacterium]
MKNIYIILNILFLLIFFNVSFTTPVVAAEVGNKILFSINPTSPGPQENTSVSIRSFAADIKKSLVIWYLDGVEYERGYNRSVIDFVTGKLGETTQLTAEIRKTGQKTLKETITILPVEINLLWRSDSYRPAFYRSQPPVSTGSKVEMTVVVNFKNEDGITIDPQSLVYNWEQNYQTISSRSGIGKSNFVFTKNQGDDNIKVIIETKNGKAIGEKSIVISSEKPIVSLYEVKPIMGVNWTHAINNKEVLGGEKLSIKAEPYGLFSKNYIETGTFNWTINNNKTGGQDGNPALTTLLSSSLIGRQDINLSLDVSNKYLPANRAVLKRMFFIDNAIIKF